MATQQRQRSPLKLHVALEQIWRVSRLFLTRYRQMERAMVLLIIESTWEAHNGPLRHLTEATMTLSTRTGGYRLPLA